RERSRRAPGARPRRRTSRSGPIRPWLDSANPAPIFRFRQAAGPGDYEDVPELMAAAVRSDGGRHPARPRLDAVERVGRPRQRVQGAGGVRQRPRHLRRHGGRSRRQGARPARVHRANDPHRLPGRVRHTPDRGPRPEVRLRADRSRGGDPRLLHHAPARTRRHAGTERPPRADAAPVDAAASLAGPVPVAVSSRLRPTPRTFLEASMDHPSTSSRIETLAVHGGERRPGPDGSIVFPIYQGTVFTYDDDASYHDIKYIRLNTTPSQKYLHDKIAALEGAEAAVATSSGMAAVTCCLHTLLKAGDHIIAGDTLYGGTHTFLTEHAPALGWQVTFVDP